MCINIAIASPRRRNSAFTQKSWMLRSGLKANVENPSKHIATPAGVKLLVAIELFSACVFRRRICQDPYLEESPVYIDIYGTPRDTGGVNSVQYLTAETLFLYSSNVENICNSYHLNAYNAR